LWQAGNAFHAEHHLQRDNHVNRIDLTARRCVELFLDMLVTLISPGDLSAGRRIKPRTSASVFSVITLGIFSGRGNGRDQFGRVRSRNDITARI
jgi:hypothetical protein